MKFKKGDVVRVIKKVSEEFYWENSWVERMDKYIGRVLTVDYYSSFGVYFEEAPGYGFPPSSLELVKSIGDLEKPENNAVVDAVVNAPKHYMLLEDKQVQVRDVCQTMANRLVDAGYSGSFVADYVQMQQYLLRFDKKNGKEDILKAEFYMKKLLEELEGLENAE